MSKRLAVLVKKRNKNVFVLRMADGLANNCQNVFCFYCREKVALHLGHKCKQKGRLRNLHLDYLDFNRFIRENCQYRYYGLLHCTVCNLEWGEGQIDDFPEYIEGKEHRKYNSSVRFRIKINCQYLSYYRETRFEKDIVYSDPLHINNNNVRDAKLAHFKPLDVICASCKTKTTGKVWWRPTRRCAICMKRWKYEKVVVKDNTKLPRIKTKSLPYSNCCPDRVPSFIFPEMTLPPPMVHVSREKDFVLPDLPEPPEERPPTPIIMADPIDPLNRLEICFFCTDVGDHTMCKKVPSMHIMGRFTRLAFRKNVMVCKRCLTVCSECGNEPAVSDGTDALPKCDNCYYRCIHHGSSIIK